jgi:hypothetical protein
VLTTTTCDQGPPRIQSILRVTCSDAENTRVGSDVRVPGGLSLIARSTDVIDGFSGIGSISYDSEGLTQLVFSQVWAVGAD